MGYFEGLTASSFKTDRNGQVIFYPWGKIGKEYILSGEEKQIGFANSLSFIMLFHSH